MTPTLASIFRRQPAVWVFLSYLGLTAILTAPLVRQIGNVLPSDGGDPVLNTWILWWSTQAMPLSDQWWSPPIFLPVTDVFAFSEHLLGLLPLSGPAAIEGHQVLKGLEFAVKEANAAGGALDREIVLVVEDDEANTTRGVIAVRKLIETDKVPFIVGTYASAVVIATMQITKEYGVPLLSGGSTSVAATDANEPGNPWFFRSWPSSVDQGLDTANAITGRFGAKTVAIIHDSGSYGYSLGDQVEQVVKDNGGEILSRDTYNAGEQDFTTLLTRIRSEKPDAVYIGGWAGDVPVRGFADLGLRLRHFARAFGVGELLRLMPFLQEMELEHPFYRYALHGGNQERVAGDVQILLEEEFPEALLSGFATYSRFGGPREGVFTALCRKNFGCSHFIIGRDHAGSENIYNPNAAFFYAKKYNPSRLR